MSKVKNEWEQAQFNSDSERWNSALEEIHQENQATVEQLKSDLEDAKINILLLEETVKNWKSIAQKDHARAMRFKAQMEKAEQRLAIGWFNYD